MDIGRHPVNNIRIPAAAKTSRAFPFLYFDFFLPDGNLGVRVLWLRRRAEKGWESWMREVSKDRQELDLNHSSS
jgi:hypothetical protein